ncbi:unnamed protein product [Clonostachys rosea f. rosea IK726]|uniref:Uncharacterized protein n=2 Tax=Bionectria ochroleuca TaxID=29856 RepID=A0A0B7K8I2_BIOOC|nr:unnamed protein product [Clonostachys rosea f. rosea IK726]
MPLFRMARQPTGLSPIWVATLQSTLLSTISNMLAQVLTAYKNATIVDINWAAVLKFTVWTLVNVPPNFLCVLQYYTACFGGTKAYQGDDGKLRLFQINFNYKFMLNSSFDTSALDKLLGDLVALEAAQWLPRDRKGETLYLRPTHTGTIASLGVQKPSYSKVYAR